MSDYVHKKAVRLPFPKSILEKYSTEDPYDCEEYFKEKLGDLWDHIELNSFTLSFTDKSMYIDWIYYKSYGEESGDWGHSRYLTKKELKTIKPYFKKLDVEFLDSDLRVVDYCYYNCSEPDDCYDVVTEKNDDSELFLTKADV